MPWRAGVSGNPRGRPRKGLALTDLLREAAESLTEDGLTRKQVMVNKIWEMAEGGNLAAARLILEYVDGKPVERVEAVIEPMPPFTADEAARAIAGLRDWEPGEPLLDADHPIDGEV